MKIKKLIKWILPSILISGLILGIRAYDPACISECVEKFVDQTEICGTFLAAGLPGILGFGICEAFAFAALKLCESTCL